jgi:hypothetical protein
MMTGIVMVGLAILTRSFYRPAGMLRRVAKPRSETLRNKNPWPDPDEEIFAREDQREIMPFRTSVEAAS